MTEALLLASAASLVAVGAANLVVAGLALRTARRYVELAEARMERLREDQVRLAVLLSEERSAPEKEWQHDHRRDAGSRIERLKRELLAPVARDAARESGGGTLGTAVYAGRRADEPRPGGDAPSAGTKTPPSPAKVGETRRKSPLPAGFPQTSRGSSPPREGGSRRAVWHPHPDDDVSPGAPSGERERTTNGTPVEIFRRHYDKYLDNYEGYVKLAARIRRMRDEAGAPGSPAEQEWKERLRRVDDGIKRTTARLDILEEYNPELATDDRVSRRASIASAHSAL